MLETDKSVNVREMYTTLSTIQDFCNVRPVLQLFAYKRKYKRKLHLNQIRWGLADKTWKCDQIAALPKDEQEKSKWI